MSEIWRLQSSFATTLPSLVRAWRRESDVALAAHNLSVATALPLVGIERLGNGIRQKELADALGIEEASLSAVLTQLCGAGLVERRANPRDRRANCLHLTRAGRETASAAEAVLATVRARLLKDVCPTDLAATLRVFQAIEQSVGRSALPPAKEVA
jgi:MarR family transcriptional regulator for hemolysin